MPKLRLSKKNINKLEFAEKGQAIDYWDTDLKGFGLRVGEKTMTFMVKVDVKTTPVDNPLESSGADNKEPERMAA